MIQMPRFQCRGLGSILGWGTKIPHAHVPPGSALKKNWMNKYKAGFSWVINILDNPKMSSCELVELQEYILRHGTRCLLRFPSNSEMLGIYVLFCFCFFVFFGHSMWLAGS